MFESLKQLIATKGVIGAYIANTTGHIVAQEGKLSHLPLLKMTAEIRDLLINEKVKQQDDPARVHYEFDNMVITIQKLKVGFLVIVSEPLSANALLRLSINVVCSQLNNNPKLLKSIATA
ncbi:hypothetical protein GF337_12245 [candidate division KSB1 bacterium]|nr:hypothetical protein [candidate division KSB1 bacterium]